MKAVSNGTKVECKRSRNRWFTIRTILNRCLLEDIPISEMLALDVDDKRKFAKLLELLPPLPDSCAHLKRINGGRILVGRTMDELSDELVEKLKTLISEERFIQAKVPSLKPLSRAQFLTAKEYWPTAFHKDNALEKKLVDSLFDEKSVKIYADLYMKVEYIKGALVYDPATNSIVAGPVARNVVNPLEHAIMRLLQSLAAVHSADSSTRKPLSGDAYLATGMDVIVDEEPCTMCAMALVHSRAKRVIFGRPNVDCGALVSRWRIQEELNINHHYEVFQIVEKF